MKSMHSVFGDPKIWVHLRRFVFAICFVLGPAPAAKADLMLTPAGVAEGFSLSTFATNFPNFVGIGPLGIAFPDPTGVMVSDFAGNVRVFPTHADGQNAASVPPEQNYGGGVPTGIARVGNSFYMGTKFGQVLQLNPNGTFNQVIVSGLPAAQDLRANPANGHLFLSTQAASIYNIDPIAKTASPLVPFAGAFIDGLTVTADGRFIYVADSNNGFREFNATTGALVATFSQGLIPGIDGLALGFGTLDGKIFANTNFGQVFEIDLANANSPVLIATGGSRGDFVTNDPLDNSLLLTQTNSIVRLHAPPGGGFGAVPEPGTLLLLGLGSLGLLGYSWRRRQQAA